MAFPPMTPSAAYLPEICMENGIKKGYKIAVGEPTSVIPQHISIMDFPGTILMDKVLTAIPHKGCEYFPHNFC